MSDSSPVLGFETPGHDALVVRAGLPAIVVAGAVGRGPTPLAAFDDALFRVGVHDRNLIVLSSVAPPGSRVVAADRVVAPGNHGDRLYVVRSEMRSAEPGFAIAAGLGWLQGDDGRGVLVEHEAVRSDGDCERLERELRASIAASLTDLATRRDMVCTDERTGSRIVAARVSKQAASALVVAVYQAEAWR